MMINSFLSQLFYLFVVEINTYHQLLTEILKNLCRYLTETFFTTSSMSKKREKKPWDEVGKPASFPVLLAFFDIGYSSSLL